MPGLGQWLELYASDNPVVKHRAARALLRRSDEAPLAVLLDILDNLWHEQLGEPAVGALEKRRDPDLIDEMIARLGSSEIFVRDAACRVLGRSRNPAATLHLVEMLDDPHLRVRRAAAFALGWLKDPAATTALERQLARRQNDDINVVFALRSALCDLGAMKEEGVFAVLQERLERIDRPSGTRGRS